jgi:hypothetical protein
MQHTWRLRRGGAVAVAMPMVVLVLLGLVEKVVHQNGGKGGKEKTWEEMGGSGVETRKQWSRGERSSNGEWRDPSPAFEVSKGAKGNGVKGIYHTRARLVVVME